MIKICVLFSPILYGYETWSPNLDIVQKKGVLEEAAEEYIQT
jgi:hypothetical protein